MPSETLVEVRAQWLERTAKAPFVGHVADLVDSAEVCEVPVPDGSVARPLFPSRVGRLTWLLIRTSHACLLGIRNATGDLPLGAGGMALLARVEAPEAATVTYLPGDGSVATLTILHGSDRAVAAPLVPYPRYRVDWDWTVTWYPVTGANYQLSEDWESATALNNWSTDRNSSLYITFASTTTAPIAGARSLAITRGTPATSNAGVYYAISRSIEPEDFYRGGFWRTVVRLEPAVPVAGQTGNHYVGLYFLSHDRRVTPLVYEAYGFYLLNPVGTQQVTGWVLGYFLNNKTLASLQVEQQGTFPTPLDASVGLVMEAEWRYNSSDPKTLDMFGRVGIGTDFAALQQVVTHSIAPGDPTHRYDHTRALCNEGPNGMLTALGNWSLRIDTSSLGELNYTQSVYMNNEFYNWDYINLVMFLDFTAPIRGVGSWRVRRPQNAATFQAIQQNFFLMREDPAYGWPTYEDGVPHPMAAARCRALWRLDALAGVPGRYAYIGMYCLSNDDYWGDMWDPEFRQVGFMLEIDQASAIVTRAILAYFPTSLAGPWTVLAEVPRGTAALGMPIAMEVEWAVDPLSQEGRCIGRLGAALDYSDLMEVVAADLPAQTFSASYSEGPFGYYDNTTGGPGAFDVRIDQLETDEMVEE